MKRILLSLTLILYFTSNIIAQVPQSERDALISFYNATDGDNWTDNSNWNTTEPVSTWFGITTEIISGQEHVTELKPNANNLNGTIPPEITDLTELRNLWIQSNYLTGQIPSNIGNLTHLTQFVLNNNFGMTGNIPASFTNCTNLQYLIVQAHQFEGTLPDFTSLTNLSILWIGYNNFEFGDFENEFSTYQTNLGSNFTYSNQNLVDTETNVVAPIGFSTTISASISGSQNNYQWYKEGSILTGETSENLNITINSESDYGAYYYEATSNIVSGLTLQSNNFNFDDLPSNNLDYNTLLTFYNSTNGDSWINNTNWLDNTTPLNSWHGVTVENGRVTRLELGSNNLNGVIPSEIGSLSELKYLWLWANQLTGSIPPEIGNLTNLIEMDLSPNTFTGSIPSEIGNLVNLEILWLNQNGLTGNIPMSFQNLINLKELYLIGSVGIDSEWSSSAYNGEFPDLTALPLETLYMQNNFFQFDDIADEFATYQANIPNFTFNPQYTIDPPEEITSDTGSDIILTLTDVAETNINSSMTSNNYQWFKDDALITGANASTYTIVNAQISDSGIYYCEVTNIDLPGFIIRRSNITVNVGTLSLDKNELNTLNIYPNPAKDILNIKQNSESTLEIKLFDAQGRLVINENSKKELVRINISYLQAGLYFIKIQSNKSSIIKHIIKK